MLIPTIFSSHKDYHIVNKDTLKNMILVTENTRNSHLEVFYKKSVLGNFTKFTGKQLCQRLFFNKVAGLRPPCFLVDFVKFPRTPFFTEHLKHEQSLFLTLCIYIYGVYNYFRSIAISISKETGFLVFFLFLF